MSCLWLSLCVLYVATFPQSQGSEVSLNCNETVKAVAKQPVTLNCSISFLKEHCQCVLYYWNNTRGDMQCNGGSMDDSCECDSLSYVPLTIANVTEEENYTIIIQSNCGVVKSTIKLQVIQCDDPNIVSLIFNKTVKAVAKQPVTLNCSINSPIEPRQGIQTVIQGNDSIIGEQTTDHHATAIILGLFLTLVVLGILFFLFRTNRGRKIMRHIKKEKVQEQHSNMEAADSLVA